MVLSLIFEIYRKLYGPIKAWIRAERLGARTCMACVDCLSGEHAAKHVGCSSALAGSYRTGNLAPARRGTGHTAESARVGRET